MKMINTLFVIFALSIFSMSFIEGCKTTTIQVIDNGNIVTNTVPMSGFNDERYIWENWQFSTNRVDKIQ